MDIFKKETTNMKQGCLIFIVAMLVGCSGARQNIVNRSATEPIKKVALVAVSGNRVLVGGGGLLTSALSIAKGLIKKEEPNKEGFAMKSLVDYGRQTFTEVLINAGWEVISSDTMTKHPSYQLFMLGKSNQVTGLLSAMVALQNNLDETIDASLNNIFPEDLVQFQIKPDAYKKDLLELCKGLGVDAVAILDLNLSYGGSLTVTVGGTGPAKGNVVATLNLLTKDGEWAFDVTSAASETSNETIPMILGEISLSNATNTLFKNTIDKTATWYKGQIKSGLGK